MSCDDQNKTVKLHKDLDLSSCRYKHQRYIMLYCNFVGDYFLLLVIEVISLQLLYMLEAFLIKFFLLRQVKV